MNDAAFRTVVVEKSAALSLSDGIFILKNEDGVFELPLSQLSSVILAVPNMTVSVALLQKLTENHIQVMLCDEKRNPAGLLLPVNGHDSSAGRIMSQARWDEGRKALVWQRIVVQKIGNSIGLLKACGMQKDADRLAILKRNVSLGDRSNREALAAKLYFNALFGKSFHREQDCTVNAALNYGYAILASHISRCIAAAGYCGAIGIFHKSTVNAFNLTYDLIEPFRVFVDRLVWSTGEKPFDKDYRHRLIELCDTEVKYNGKTCRLSYAMDCFCHDVLKSMKLSADAPLNFGSVEMK